MRGLLPPFLRSIASVVEVETPRLLLRPWGDEYLDDFARIVADPRVMRYISWGRPLGREEAAEISNRTRGLWETYGFGPWPALDRETGRWVGRVGLNLLEDWPRPDRWEVGWELDPDFWGRGLATEGGRAGVRFGLTDVGLERIISVTVPEHLASRRVMEKCGLTYRGRIHLRHTECVWYAIERADLPTDG